MLQGRGAERQLRDSGRIVITRACALPCQVSVLLGHGCPHTEATAQLSLPLTAQPAQRSRPLRAVRAPAVGRALSNTRKAAGRAAMPCQHRQLSAHRHPPGQRAGAGVALCMLRAAPAVKVQHRKRWGGAHKQLGRRALCTGSGRVRTRIPMIGVQGLPAPAVQRLAQPSLPALPCPARLTPAARPTPPLLCLCGGAGRALAQPIAAPEPNKTKGRAQPSVHL